MARQSYYSGQKLSQERVARLLRKAGFRGNDLINMLAIAGRESGYDPGAHGTDQPRSALSGDRGLWQINYLHDPGLRSAGIISNPADLFDPMTNARAARYLYERSGLSPWTAGPGGWRQGGDPLYGTNVDAARAVVQQLRQQGWGGGGGGGGGAPNLREIAEGLANLGDPRYRQYISDPRSEVAARRAVLQRILGAGSRGLPAPRDPTFFNWQQHPELNQEYSGPSPHLEAFERWTLKRYGGADVGTHAERPVRGGGAPSSHAFGAAWDWDPDSRTDADEMIGLVTKNPGAYGIQAIHDYANSRVWRVGRGWQEQPRGSHGGQMGSSQHLHFETNPDTWNRVGKRNWRMMAQAARGRYTEGGPSVTPQQWATTARKLANQGDPRFEDYATISGAKLQEAQRRYALRGRVGAGPVVDPAAQRALEKMLRGFGIKYPEGPNPTPGLLAYLNSLNLTVSTARDIRRKTVERVRINRQAAQQDVRRQAGRTKENITGSLVSRGVLGSGEATERYTEHAQDVAAELAGIGRESAGATEAARLGYRQSFDAMRQQALDRVLDVEREQAIERATRQAETRGLRRARRAENRSARRTRQAQEAAWQRQEDLLRRYGSQGVSV